jgi:hypothetical protein
MFDIKEWRLKGGTMMRLRRAALPITVGCCLLSGCSRRQTLGTSEQAEIGPSPSVQVALKTYGLPEEFFTPGYDTKCASQVIGYRFVVWLDDAHVAVGFNASPNCRQSPDLQVSGSLRLLVFDVRGTLKARRDLPYLADGNGELVADGEGMAGPGGTLLVRIESVNLDAQGRNESKSGMYLLDSNLKDVARLDKFLEQTTFVGHALVWQNGITWSGPRKYSIMTQAVPEQIMQRQIDWPTGALDRKFGEHGFAFMLCGQEVSPGKYTSSNLIHADAKFRCAVNAEDEDGNVWTSRLQDGETAALVGLLADGTVAGVVHSRNSRSGRLTIWEKNGKSSVLPWLPPQLEGEVNAATSDLSRYGSFANSDARPCNAITKVLGQECDEDGDGRWFIFDRSLHSPIVDRRFPKNGRAALSPDGLHYASFEAKELRIYSLRTVTGPIAR